MNTHPHSFSPIVKVGIASSTELLGTICPIVLLTHWAISTLVLLIHSGPPSAMNTVKENVLVECNLIKLTHLNQPILTCYSVAFLKTNELQPCIYDFL